MTVSVRNGCVMSTSGFRPGSRPTCWWTTRGWILYQHLLERLVSEEPNKGDPAAPRPSPCCLPVSAAMTMDLYGHLHREHPLARQCFLGRDLLIPAAGS
jgi:hypothetical protein